MSRTWDNEVSAVRSGDIMFQAKATGVHSMTGNAAAGATQSDHCHRGFKVDPGAAATSQGVWRAFRGLAAS